MSEPVVPSSAPGAHRLLLLRRRKRAQIPDFQGKFGNRADDLRRLTVSDVKCRPKNFVALHYLIEGRSKCRRDKRTGESHGCLYVVGRVAGNDLIQEPESLLRE